LDKIPDEEWECPACIDSEKKKIIAEQRKKVRTADFLFSVMTDRYLINFVAILSYRRNERQRKRLKRKNARKRRPRRRLLPPSVARLTKNARSRKRNTAR